MGSLLSDNEPLLTRLIEEGESLDRAGTRIWAASEAAFKASGVRPALSIISVERDETGDETSVLFRCNRDNSDCRVLTFPVFLTLGGERMLAVAGQPETGKNIRGDSDIQEIAPPDSADSSVNDSGNFTHEFITTFTDSRRLSGRVCFTSIPKWMGAFRELTLLPIAEPLLKSIRSRQWGMVTNVSSFKVERHIDIFDKIIGRITLTDDTDLSESFIALAFEWLKKNRDGREERVATSIISSTWVSIRGRGIVRKAPLPDYFRKYLARLPSVDSMENPKGKVAVVSSLVPIVATDRTDRGRYLLDQQQFLTSMEDSNLVGNIYYAHYYSWQARVRDNYLFRRAPDVFKENNRGEFIGVQAEVSHLQEAMPFECIEVSMYLSEVFEEGVVLYFEYHSINEQRKNRKLAHGIHTAIWTTTDSREATVRPAKMPEVFLADFMAIINEQ